MKKNNLKNKVICIILARGGSKGLKDKNLINLSGKPLIAYSIEASKMSKYISRTIVSTDSEKIKKIALSYQAEVPFVRPHKFSQDSSTYSQQFEISNNA